MVSCFVHNIYNQFSSLGTQLKTLKLKLVLIHIWMRQQFKVERKIQVDEKSQKNENLRIESKVSRDIGYNSMSSDETTTIQCKQFATVSQILSVCGFIWRIPFSRSE